jgi:diketogulonate reductase-like aldo/keto reductase
MEKLQRAGKAKAIGISNFSKQETTRILNECTIVPAVHQLELHPWLQQTSFVDFLKGKGIHVTQYSSLGNQNEIYGGREKIGRLVDDETLVKIGKKYGKSGAQIALG